MTAANVVFLDLDGEPVAADVKPTRFSFRCVRWNRDKHPSDRRETPCGGLLIAEGPHSAAHGIKRDGQGNNGGRPQWDFDGDRTAPTFSPSINCAQVCGWHGYIRAGRCVDTSGRDEPD